MFWTIAAIVMIVIGAIYISWLICEDVRFTIRIRIVNTITFAYMSVAFCHIVYVMALSYSSPFGFFILPGILGLMFAILTMGSLQGLLRTTAPLGFAGVNRAMRRLGWDGAMLILLLSSTLAFFVWKYF